MARKGPARRPHVGIRALREQAATFVKRAQSGDAVVITVNGEPVAELGPIGKSIVSIIPWACSFGILAPIAVMIISSITQY